MTSKAKVLTGLILLVLLLLATSVALALYYRGNAIDYKSQRDTATSNLRLAKDTITDMQTRQRDVAAIDEKFTKELADANTENDRIRAKLAAGSRVRVAGECKSQSTASGSVGNAETVELSSGAGSNVLDIRAGIINDQAKVRYLQQYINEQCFK